VEDFMNEKDEKSYSAGVNIQDVTKALVIIEKTINATGGLIDGPLTFVRKPNGSGECLISVSLNLLFRPRLVRKYIAQSQQSCVTVKEDALQEAVTSGIRTALSKAHLCSVHHQGSPVDKPQEC
jgi:hypothetical protein